MIKRRFYRHEHDDRDAPSDSSSSSDSELEAEVTEDTEEEEDDEEVEMREKDQHRSSSSGYESEDSSANEVDLNSSGLLANDGDMGAENDKRDVNETQLYAENNVEMDNMHNTEADKDAIPSGITNCVLKSKSVFKCKLCPRIVCLTEETLMAHLKSKRHARSEKLLSDGRLKLMLNSDGEIEGEPHQERHAATLASVQSNKNPANSKKNRGRQRQRKRLKKKTTEVTSNSTRISAKKPTKKRHKSNI